MAHIQEQVSNKMMDYIKQMLVNSSKITSEILALAFVSIHDSLKEGSLKRRYEKGKKAKSKDFQLLRKMGEKVNYITIAEEDLEVYKQILKHNKVFYISYQLNKDEEIDNKDLIGGGSADKKGKVYQISYINDQRNRIEASTEILMSLYNFKNEISMDTFNLYYNGIKSKCIEGFSPEEYEVFKDHALKNNLTYAAELSDGKYSIYYGYDQEDNAFNTMIGLGLDLTAPKKEDLLSKAKHSISNRESFEKAIKGQGEMLYAVNTTNPNMYIKLTDMDYTFYKNGKVVRSLNRDEKAFDQEIIEKIKELDNYVVLTQEEFLMPDEMKKKVIKERDNLYPDGFYDTFTIEDHTFEHREAAIAHTNNNFEVFNIIPGNDEYVDLLDKVIAEAKTKQKKYTNKKNKEDKNKTKDHDHNHKGGDNFER